ncbi:hypothetical protein Btru_034990 [Bulinus truncatus]|nr:hypothetical protein Btru_034990 [Bulinus truncatus]
MQTGIPNKTRGLTADDKMENIPTSRVDEDEVKICVILFVDVCFLSVGVGCPLFDLTRTKGVNVMIKLYLTLQLPPLLLQCCCCNIVKWIDPTTHSMAFFLLQHKGVHFLQMAKKKILSHLLLVQVVISILTVILSAMVFFPLGLNFRSFNDQCLLYANVKLIPKTEEAVGVKIDLTTTLFGDVEECNYTTYLNVVVAIASVIFLWFFYHTRSLDTSEHSEVKLQLPVLLVHLGMLVCVMVSSCKITIGFNQWCANLAYTDPTKNFKHCKDYENLSWDVTTRAYECPFYTFNLLAEASSWLLAFALFLQCIVTSVRLYQDFVTTFQEAEVPHKKLDEVDDTDSLCLELGLTNQGSDEFIDTGANIVEVEKYNPEAKRIQLAEAIIHQHILAMASGDQLPSKKNPAQPIVLDTESFKKKSKAKKAGVTDFVYSGVETATESLKKKKMIELQPMVPHVLVSVPDASGSINSEGEDFDTTEGDESHRLNQEQKTMDYMNSRKCPDGQW